MEQNMAIKVRELNRDDVRVRIILTNRKILYGTYVGTEAGSVELKTAFFSEWKDFVFTIKITEDDIYEFVILKENEGGYPPKKGGDVDDSASICGNSMASKDESGSVREIGENEEKEYRGKTYAEQRSANFSAKSCNEDASREENNQSENHAKDRRNQSPRNIKQGGTKENEAGKEKGLKDHSHLFESYGDTSVFKKDSEITKKGYNYEESMARKMAEPEIDFSGYNLDNGNKSKSKHSPIKFVNGRPRFNQLLENERRFGIKAVFKESDYCDPINKNDPNYKKYYEDAREIAKTIENEKRGTKNNYDFKRNVNTRRDTRTTKQEKVEEVKSWGRNEKFHSKADNKTEEVKNWGRNDKLNAKSDIKTEEFKNWGRNEKLQANKAENKTEEVKVGFTGNVDKKDNDNTEKLKSEVKNEKFAEKTQNTTEEAKTDDKNQKCLEKSQNKTEDDKVDVRTEDTVKPKNTTEEKINSDAFRTTAKDNWNKMRVQIEENLERDNRNLAERHSKKNESSTDSKKYEGNRNNGLAKQNGWNNKYQYDTRRNFNGKAGFGRRGNYENGFKEDEKRVTENKSISEKKDVEAKNIDTTKEKGFRAYRKNWGRYKEEKTEDEKHNSVKSPVIPSKRVSVGSPGGSKYSSFGAYLSSNKK